MEFDLIGVNRIIKEHGYKRIALQFPDDQLRHSVYVLKQLRSSMPDVLLFVTADSTWGSSVDDVSALHYSADVLLYFGSDLSSSGSIPVVVVVPQKTINISECGAAVNEYTSSILKANENSSFLVLYEPSYFNSVKELTNVIDSTVVFAALPNCADLQNWSPTKNSVVDTLLGGLVIDSDALSKENCCLIYIGEKQEQLVNILLSASRHTIFSYSPQASTGHVLNGSESLEFRERYGGVMKVKDAKIVGIIVGSMGLTAESTQALLHRLKTLIRAAKKKYYCFVMGRLNEAKLCNFPEVDVYCLVSNDDHVNIKPKTFHVPVITPYELELGLGAHEWTSSYCGIGSLLNGSHKTLEEALAAVVANVESDCDSEDDDETYRFGDKTDIISVNGSSGGSEWKNNQQLSVFSSAAVEYFQTREFQGLTAEVPQGHDTELHNGTFGVASEYRLL